MNIIHVYVKFEDLFSFAITEKIVTVSEDSYDKMVEGIGSTFSRKTNNPACPTEHLKVKEVRQATAGELILHPDKIQPLSAKATSGIFLN